MSKANSNHFYESLASEEEGLIQETIAQGKKINPKKVVFITRDPNGRIVWLEEGLTSKESTEADKTPTGLKHILEEHTPDFCALGVEARAIPEFLKKLVESGEIIGRRNRGVVYRNPAGAGKRPIEIVVASNGYIVTAFPLRDWKENGHENDKVSV